MDIPEPEPARWKAATGLAQRAPQPAVSGGVQCGTAGWTDRTLIQCGRFYPPGASSARARLEHYARHFRLVEVDATYYTLVGADTVARWVEYTPEGFRFDVKAFPVLTGHPIDVLRLPQDLRAVAAPLANDRGRVSANRLPDELRLELEGRFRASLQPLVEAGRLGAVLCQFPPWFEATRGNARALERLADEHRGIPLSVEFRHRSWLASERRDRVFDLLRHHGLTFVAVDEPASRVGGLPPVIEATTSRLAVVRFHGRNVAGWDRRGAGVHERFDYLYTPDELRPWVEPLRRVSEEVREVHAVFNNCVRDYAVVNAKGLSVLIGGSEAG